MMAATWQDWAVAAIAVLVLIALIYRVWRFFSCRGKTACSSCDKECPLRKKQ
ncbi:MAG: hypothetical protein IIV55_04950 [Alistipes sp.]|nr:hypothetical protein [Alistipes sp.]MEE0863593.1 hypothetical protein [Alistipes sp.]